MKKYGIEYTYQNDTTGQRYFKDEDERDALFNFWEKKLKAGYKGRVKSVRKVGK